MKGKWKYMVILGLLVGVCKGAWDAYESIFRVELNSRFDIEVKYSSYIRIDAFIIISSLIYVAKLAYLAKIIVHWLRYNNFPIKIVRDNIVSYLMKS